MTDTTTRGHLGPRRALTAGLTIAVVVAGLLLPSSSAQASETYYLNALNCGSSLVLSSAKTNYGAQHWHSYNGQTRNKYYTGGAAYVTSYYNSGFTAVSQVRLDAGGNFQSKSRSCDW